MKILYTIHTQFQAKKAVFTIDDKADIIDIGERIIKECNNCYLKDYWTHAIYPYDGIEIMVKNDSVK